jgi:predicted HicB family RNase H-like nuclease
MYSHLKRLVMDIPKELHSKIKSEAAIRNISMKEYVKRALAEKLSRDEKYKS